MTVNHMRVSAARGAAIALFVLASSLPSAAQSNTSANDIQRLQDDIYQASGELMRMRGTQGQVSNLQNELDDLRDEVTYLKVKLRKEGTVRWSEYAEVRDRIQTFRSRTRGNSNDGRGNDSTTPWSGGTQTGGTVYDQPRQPDQRNTRQTDQRTTDQRSTSQGSYGDIPVGQEIDVRLSSELTSDTAQVEQRFEATTMVDLYRGDDVLIPAGSMMRGVVSSVNRASRTDRRGSMTVSFDQVTVRGRNYPLRGTVTEALQSDGLKGEAARIGAGSAVGAIIGGIMGGAKGALLGVLIGGGGTIAATEGKDVTLPPGTVLRVRLETPPNIR